MKRYLVAVAVVALATTLLEARGNGRNNGSHSGNKSNDSSGGNAKVVANGAGQGSKSNDSGKSQNFNGKVSDFSKSQGDKGFTYTKLDLHGNKNVATLPGFKSDPKLHTQLLQKYNVPKQLYDHCFFHHDFCWNSYCWLPGFGCCCYWHPYSHCWYYWYEPYRCYLPYSYIEVYRPVVETTPVVVNVNNTNTNTNNNVEAEDPTSLPPGAVATLPPDINPVVPEPKQ
jgi:hypothetical protein